MAPSTTAAAVAMALAAAADGPSDRPTADHLNKWNSVSRRGGGGTRPRRLPASPGTPMTGRQDYRLSRGREGGWRGAGRVSVRADGAGMAGGLVEGRKELELWQCSAVAWQGAESKRASDIPMLVVRSSRSFTRPVQ